jgi:ATP-dependent DNA helicase PIF1
MTSKSEKDIVRKRLARLNEDMRLSENKKRKALRKSEANQVKPDYQRSASTEELKHPIDVKATICKSLNGFYNCVFDTVDSLPKELKKHTLSTEEKNRLIESYNQVMDPFQNFEICGACGVKALHDERKFHSFSPTMLKLFLRKDTPNLGETSSFLDGSYYHLHPKSTEDRSPMEILCDNCLSHIRKKHTLPPWSIGAGMDYGTRPKNLPNLSLVEELLIAQAIPFGCLLQLSPEGDAGIKGHMISFLNSGPETFVKSLPNVLALEKLTVIFRGNKQHLGIVQKSVDTVLSVRPRVIFDWLDFLIRVNPYYSDITWLTDIDLQFHRKQMIERIQFIDDEEAVKIDQMATGDLGVNPSSSGKVDFIFLQTSQDYSPLSTEDTSAQISKRFTSLAPVRSDDPVSEFERNDAIFILAFPHLFLLGRCLKHTGKFSQSYVTHLLLQRDNRFAQDHRFLFLCFNQLQRHLSISAIKQRIKAKPSERLKIEGILNDEKLFGTGMTAEMMKEKMMNDPSYAAKMHSLLQFIDASAANIPLTPAESRHNLSKIEGMMVKYGLPSWWITLSPGLQDSILVLRLSQTNEMIEGTLPLSEDVPDLLIPSNVGERLRVLAQNPVHASRVFHKLVDCVLMHLFKLDLNLRTEDTRQYEAGCLGVLTNYFMVFEAQGRGALHFHALFWGSISPEVLQTYSHDPEASEKLGEWFDSVWSGSLSQTSHANYKEHRKKPWDQPVRAGLYQCPSQVDSIHFQERYEAIAPALLTHVHNLTCHKGTTGKKGCRGNMPCPQYPVTRPVQLKLNSKSRTISASVEIEQPTPTPKGQPKVFPLPDSRLINWELKRPLSDDRWIVSHLPLLCNVVGCNTHANHLGSLEQAKSIVYYIAEYACKGATMLTSALAPMYEAKKKLASSESVDDQTKTFLQIFLNKVNGAAEISAQQAASTLLGHKSFQTEESFWYCFINHAIAAFSRKETHLATSSIVPPSELEESDSELDDRDPEFFCSSEEDDDENDAEEASFQFNPVDLADGTLNDLSHEMPEGSDFFEEKQKWSIVLTDRIHLTAQPEDYRCRGDDLQHLNFYEYCSLISVLKEEYDQKTTANTSSSSDFFEAYTTGAGRPKNLRFQFTPSHQFYRTHVQRIRSKPATVILAGKIPPYPGKKPKEKSQQWQKKAECFAQFCSILLIPWEINSDEYSLLHRMTADLDRRSKYFWTRCLQRFWKNKDSMGQELMDSNLHSKRQRIYLNIVQMKSICSNKKTLLTRWRTRAQTRWSEEKVSHVKQQENMNSMDEEAKINDIIDELRQLHPLTGKITDNERSKIFLNHQERIIELFFSETSCHSASSSSPTFASLLLDQDISNVEERSERLKTLSLTHSSSLFDPTAKFSAEKLSNDQAFLINKIITHVQRNEQFFFCITGGPGTGKSFFARQLNFALFREKTGKTMLNTATTGVAASLLFEGSTLNSALFIPANISNQLVPNGCLKRLPDAKRIELVERFFRNSIDILLIDEVSMLTAENLAFTDDRLCEICSNHDVPFGGKSIILMGDFFQLEPVGTALYSKRKEKTLMCRERIIDRGLTLFQSLFKNFEIRTQHRSVDLAHTSKLENLRNQYRFPNQLFPSVNILEGLKILRPIDKENFQDATILVCSNAERNVLNLICLKNFARRFNQPILRWKKILLHGNQMVDTEDAEMTRLYNEEVFLWEYFVPGASAVMTGNLNPGIGLANGTPVKMHSLTFATDIDLDEIRRDIEAQFSEDVFVTIPAPYSVNVTPLSDLDEIVPILWTISDKEIKAKGTKKLRMRIHPLQLNYATTFHKAQGMTLSKIIIDINNRNNFKNLGKLSWNGLFVALSRVRSSDDIRLVPQMNKFAWHYVNKLKPSKHLCEFYEKVVQIE